MGLFHAHTPVLEAMIMSEKTEALSKHERGVMHLPEKIGKTLTPGVFQ
jgi:hypothetical protein